MRLFFLLAPTRNSSANVLRYLGYFGHCLVAQSNSTMCKGIDLADALVSSWLELEWLRGGFCFVDEALCTLVDDITKVRASSYNEPRSSGSVLDQTALLVLWHSR